MGTSKDILGLIKSENIEFVDFRFTDVPGLQYHYTIPAHQLSEDVFKNGLGFDGSSIRGFQSIEKSDMLLIPDPDSAFIDPFNEDPTLCLVCVVRDPRTGEDYIKDPRVIAKKAIEYMQSTGIADTSYMGPELEFFIFNAVTYENRPESSGFAVYSSEALASSAELHSPIDDIPTTGHKLAPKRGYVSLSPLDNYQDMRSEMAKTLESIGIKVELHHHEVGTAGQCEIAIRFADLLNMADIVQTYKYVVKNIAKKYGQSATFMPKPLYGDNGSGMHTHQSLWKGNNPLFVGEGYAGLSELGVHYIGGILKHSDALLAFCAPSTNSYKRLVPGYEAPINLIYSQSNRSAAIRIPLYSDSPEAKRIEYRCPDSMANPYLAFSAMMMAGLDGIINKIEPIDPLDKNIYSLSEAELKKIPTVPNSLEQSLKALEADNDFLTVGSVFSKELLEIYIEGKREEIEAVKTHPSPMEYELYYSA